MSQDEHEALHYLERGPHRYAVEKAIADRDRYERALEGIASCCTACGCCEMHRRVAKAALSNEYAEHVINAVA